MKIILAMVSSVDGKTTKGNDPNIYSWTSKEDQEYFSKLIQENDCIIMGRKTYDIVKKKLKHESGKIRVIITNNPQKFENIAIRGQLEFTNVSPHMVISKLESLNYKIALLVGGAEVNTIFLEQKLVNELWLTLEPNIFGKGNGIVGKKELEVNLRLFSAEKLNDKGSLLLKYNLL